MQKTIYIVRHGQTDFNLKKIVQGSGINSSLNTTGRQQAQAFHQYYQDINFDVVLTSTLIRTHQTMEPFIQSGLAWEQFSEIDEMNWGVHEGKAGTPEMIQEYQNMVQAWKNGNYDVGIREGETAQQLANRIQKFIAHLKQREEQSILICSHGRAMRCLMACLKNDHLYNMEQYPHANTGLYLVNYIPVDFHFQLENDVTHLEQAALTDLAKS